MSNVFIMTKDNDSRRDIALALGSIDGMNVVGQYLEDGDSDLFSLTSITSPDILVVDDTLENIDQMTMVKEMLRIFPRAGIVAIYDQKTMTAEIDAFFDERYRKLPKPLDTERVRYVVRKLMRSILKDDLDSRIPHYKKGRINSPKIIPFFSPKDGIGKTSIIVNMGWMLSQVFNQRVLIISLNSVFDDTDIFLNYKSNCTFAEAMRRFQTPSADPKVIDYIVDEHPVYKNLFVISHGDSPNEMIVAEERQYLEFFLWYIESKFDWILIDTPSVINKDLKTFMKIAANPLILIQNHIMSVRNLEIYIEILRSMEVDVRKLKFLATRVSKNIGISAEKMVKIIGDEERIFGFVPSVGKISIESITKRVPSVTLSSETDDMYLAIHAICQKLTGKNLSPKEENFITSGIKKFLGLKPNIW